MRKQKLLSVLLLAIFAFSIVSIAVPVSALFTGEITISLPDYVVPGGSIAVYSESYESDKVWTYFFLSTEKESEISSGDIEIDKVDTDDVEEVIGDWPGFTVSIPTDVEPDDYYVKISYDNDVGDDCLLSEKIWGGIAQVEVLAEKDWPTITVDPESDEVGATVDVDGEDISTDYDGTDAAKLFWDGYHFGHYARDWPWWGLMEEEVLNLSPPPEYLYVDAVEDVDEGAFSADDVVIPEAFMGDHDILVLLWNDVDKEWLGTFVEFEVEPSVDVWHAAADYDLDNSTDATAEWSTAEVYSGLYSAELYVNCSTNTNHADVVIHNPRPQPFDAISEFVYHYYLLSGSNYTAHMCFYMEYWVNETTKYTADISGPEPSTPGLVDGIYPPVYDTWTKVALDADSTGFFWYGNAPELEDVHIPQGGCNKTMTLSDWQDLVGHYWVYQIRIELGWWTPKPPQNLTGTAYVDDASLNGKLVFDEPYKYSVEAEALNQMAYIWAHGFPEDGEIDDNTVDFIIKDIKTGEDVTESTKHDDVDVEDEPPGTFELHAEALEVEVDEPPEGIIDAKFVVDSETFTFEDVLLSSTDSDPGKHKGTLSPTSGEIGDKVTFYVINLPANVDIEILVESEEGAIIHGVAGGWSDVNGAFKQKVKLPSMAGGTYTVRAADHTNDYSRKIGELEVLPTVSFYNYKPYPGIPVTDITTTYVDDMIFIVGDGFPDGSEFDTIVIGGEDIEFDDEVEVGSDGVFDSRLGFTYENFTVPHVSGGGLDVAVEIKGEDVEGDPLTIEAEITIDPKIQDVDLWDEDEEEVISEGVLVLNHEPELVHGNETYWVSYLDADYIFGGNPMKITGVGFKADESVTVTFTSEDEDIEEECLITYGGEADSDGDLEVVFMLPHTPDFASTIADGDLEVAGTTDTNEDSVFDRYEDTYLYDDPYVYVTARDDTKAKLFFGLEDDGDLDTTVYVGDEIRMVGVGFETKSLTLEIEGDEVGEPTAKYGFFDETITIPELQRGTAYVVEEVETDTDSTEFEVESNVVLSPEEAIAGVTVTAYGTGWDEDYEVDIKWPDLPKLVKDIEPDSDGSWEETFEVPDVEPGPYTITFVDEDEVEVEVTFRVLGPLRIASLSLPSIVYPESTLTVSVNVQTYFGTAITGATVTGSITPPVGTAVSLTFTEAAAGIYTASWLVPADAEEGTYTVDVTAEKPEVGGLATASGSFYVEVKVPPPPPVEIDVLEKAVTDLSGDVSSLSSDVSSLSSDVSGLKSDIAALEAAITAIPIVPVEWIYITAIMAIIAAIAAIAAVVAVYRKIA